MSQFGCARSSICGLTGNNTNEQTQEYRFCCVTSHTGVPRDLEHVGILPTIAGLSWRTCQVGCGVFPYILEHALLSISENKRPDTVLHYPCATLAHLISDQDVLSTV